MYQNNYSRQSPPRRGRYFRNAENVLYRSLHLGYHMETGEQMAVLKHMQDGTIWIIPATDLHKSVLRDGVPVRLYTEDLVYQEDDRNYQTPGQNAQIPTQPADFLSRCNAGASYPGYVDDPRPRQDQRYKTPQRNW